LTLHVAKDTIATTLLDVLAYLSEP